MASNSAAYPVVNKKYTTKLYYCTVVVDRFRMVTRNVTCTCMLIGLNFKHDATHLQSMPLYLCYIHRRSDKGIRLERDTSYYAICYWMNEELSQLQGKSFETNPNRNDIQTTNTIFASDFYPFTESREASMEYLRWVWNPSRESLPFRTPGFVSFLGLHML